MRNLKKTLVALLVVSMVIAGFTGVAGAAFSDTTGHKAANKIAKLAALGVLAGYPDGTFKPDNNITRAEFAKVACILAGLESSGDILKNSPSKFSDVPAGQWYTGWVNLAVSQGFMKGYPDGTFKPSANVTNAEVLTVLCRLIGYNDNLPGDWPIEYLVKAADLDISDGLTFDGNAPATRGNVAWFAEQSLEVQKVEWDKDAEKFVGVTYGKDEDEETILHENFEGALVKDALCYSWELSGDKQKISVYEGDGEGGFTSTSKTYVVAEDATLNGATHISGLENKIVDLAFNDDEEVIYAEVKAYGSLSDVEAEKVSDTRFKISDKTYTVNENALAKITGKREDDADTDTDDEGIGGSADWDFYANFSDEVWDDDDGYQKIYALLNEDGEIAFVRSSAEGDPGIVESVGATSKKITLKSSGGEGSDVADFNADVSDSDTTYIVFRDGKLADIKDIQENDLIWVTPADKGANGYDYKITARSTKITGKLEERDDEFTVFTIAGKDYDGWGDVQLSIDQGESFDDIDTNDGEDLDGALGENVTALLDGNGYIRAIITDVEAMDNALYGVVSEVFGSTSSSGWSTTALEIFTKDGELHKYDVDSDSADLAKAKKDETGYLFFEDEDESDTDVDDKYEAGTAGDYRVLVNSASYPEGRLLVKFTLQDDGAIDSFKIITDGDVGGTQGTWNTTTADDDPVTITIDGVKRGFDEAVVFDVSSTDPDEWQILDPDDVVDWIMTTGNISASGYFVDEGEIVCLASVTESVSSDWDYAMVMGKGFDSDGAYIKVIDNSSGNTVKKHGDDLDDDPDWSDLEKGVMIDYRLSGGEITEYDDRAGVSGKIYDVRSTGTKRISIGGDPAKWFFVDDDTLFFNFTGDDPRKIDLSEVQDLDWCKYYADANDVLKWLVVVPED